MFLCNCINLESELFTIMLHVFIIWVSVSMTFIIIFHKKVECKYILNFVKRKKC